MSKIYSARRVGEILGLPHLEVIRRIRRGDIKARKLDWNWLIREDAVEEAKSSDWYRRRVEKLERQNQTNSATT